MNNIILIITLLLLVSMLAVVISGISLLFDDLNEIDPKKDKIIFFISLITLVVSMVILTIYCINNPQPTFREVCEANNGTYIDNNGRAGDSCIYNK